MSRNAPHGWFAEMANAAPLPLLAVEAESGAILAMNRLARETLGLPQQMPALRDLFDNPALARQFLLIARNHGFIRQFEAQLRLAGGQRLWVLLAARLVEAGEQANLVVSIVDVHDRRVQEEALRESEQRHRRVLEAANEGYALFDARSGELLEVNPALCDMLCYPPDVLLQLRPEEVVAEDSLDKLRVARQRWQSAPQEHFELCLRRSTGERITVEISLSAVADQDGRIASMFALISDITTRKLNEERVLYLAFYDTLTALPNRFLFAEHLDQALKLQARHGGRLALLFIDLDDFKQVNDQHGHDVGDELLRTVAKRLVGCVRASDTVSRQGGDEFIVLLSNLQDADAAEQVASKMLSVLAEPVQIGPALLHVRASIGISLCPDHADDAITLRRLADVAMYRAKQRGKHSYATYSLPANAAAEIGIE